MRVLVTRADEQGRASKARFEAAGHVAVAAPLSRTVLDGDAVLPLDGVQALLVTSLNGVTAVTLNAAAETAKALPVLAVGDRTARAASERGFADVTSASGNRHDLAALVAERLDPAKGALLWAAGADHAPDLVAELEGRGFTVRVVEVYRVEPVTDLPQGVAEDLRSGRIDAIAVYSPKSAEILVEALAARGIDPATAEFRIHAISEAAAEPLRRAGYDRVVAAARPDEPGLLVTFVQSGAPSEAGPVEEEEGAQMASERKAKRDRKAVATADPAFDPVVEETTAAAISAEPEPVATAIEAVEAAPETTTPETGAADAVATETETAEPAPEPTAVEASAPTEPTAAEPAAPIRRGVGAGTLVGAMVAAGLLGGVAGIGAPHLLELAGVSSDPAASEAQARIAALEARVAAAEAKVAAQKPTDLAPLENRVAAIETAPALKLPNDLSERVAALQKAADERIAAAKTSIAEGLAAAPAADGAGLADLAGRIDAAIAAARESSAIEIGRLKEQLAAARTELESRTADLGDRAKTAYAEAADRLAAGVAAKQAALAETVDGLGRKLAELEGLRGEVAALNGRLGGIESSNAEAKVDRGRIAETLDRAKASTEGRVGNVENRIAAVEAGAKAAGEAQESAVLVVALADLKSAVDAGRPFAGELAVTRRAAPDGLPGLAALDGFAATGVPSPTKLREDLPKIARAMAATEEAPADAGFVDRLWTHAARLVRVRPAGEAGGESLGAQISRVEGRMAAGDLAGALAAWKALPEPARNASQAWGAALDARVAVDAALAAQTAAIVTRLSHPE